MTLAQPKQALPPKRKTAPAKKPPAAKPRSQPPKRRTAPSAQAKPQERKRRPPSALPPRPEPAMPPAQPEASSTPTGLTAFNVIAGLIGSALVMAAAWAAGWGLGAVFVFFELNDPVAVFDSISRYGLSDQHMNFVIASVSAGLLCGGLAGALMAIPYPGLFAVGPVRLLIAGIGWLSVMALSRYAAIGFNFHSFAQILAYFAITGFALGAMSAVTLNPRKQDKHLLRILVTGVIWAAIAALARNAIFLTEGL